MEALQFSSKLNLKESELDANLSENQCLFKRIQNSISIQNEKKNTRVSNI